MCDDLTPYGVKIRYSQELYIEEYHVTKALQEPEILYDWLMGILDHWQNCLCEAFGEVFSVYCVNLLQVKQSR